MTRHTVVVALALVVVAGAPGHARAQLYSQACMTVCHGGYGFECNTCAPVSQCELVHARDPAPYTRCAEEHESCVASAAQCNAYNSTNVGALTTCAAGDPAELDACCMNTCNPPRPEPPKPEPAPATVLVSEPQPPPEPPPPPPPQPQPQPETPAQEEPYEPLREGPRTWWFFDVVGVGGARTVAGDTQGVGLAGITIEALLGPRSWRGKRLPFRLGPFLTGTLGGPTDHSNGLQLSGGLSALVWARERPSGLASGLELSAGALLDLPEDQSNRVGGLVRVSAGFLGAGSSGYLAFSAWLFLEGHWIPGGDADDSRQEVLMGLRIGPLTIPMWLIHLVTGH